MNSGRLTTGDGRRTTDLFHGRLLFHCHTHLTDGEPSVEDYVRFARDRGLDRVVFLEHIRREPGYDVPAFAAAVREAGARFGTPAHVGFEAKVLPGGDLDIADEHLALAEVVGIAEHGFPDDAALWERSLAEAFRRYGMLASERAVVWVHPGLWLKKHRRLDELRPAYERLLDAAQAAGVLIEQNHRYRLLPEDFLPLVRPDCLVRGADAHRLGDAEAFLSGL